MRETLPFLMFGFTLVVLLSGYPVAFALGGAAILFSFFGILLGAFDPVFLQALPERIFGIMTNDTLLAVPLFVFMGVMLEKSKIAEDLLDTMARLLGRIPGGLGISVCLVGGLLAASTGIVGATVVTMGLISLPAMLGRRYSTPLAAGVVCASATLGQIIPPSIILVILGDIISSANQQAQSSLGNYSAATVSVGDLFLGALVPGILLMALYMVYVSAIAFFRPKHVPPIPREEWLSLTESRSWIAIFRVLLPPLFLIVGVLGSILAGVATPTEAAAVGGVGAACLAWLKKELNLTVLKDVLRGTTEVNAMVFAILIGASLFSLAFRGFSGDEVVAEFLLSLGGDVRVVFAIVMALLFFLGFFIDFFEIMFVVVPIVGPVLIRLGLNPVWLGVMIALNLQTSFLTPPFGFSLFYLRGVAPANVSTLQIYRGVVPYILIQLAVLLLLWFFPDFATALPAWLASR